jgi:multimeric flavodoxin WrbA
MAKKVLVLSTSQRKNSNSEHLCDAFCRGAQEAGCETEKISLIGKNIRFCLGCQACRKTQKCVLPDDMASILEKMKAADILVFATPIYFYEMSGQLKTLLDRTYPMYSTEYRFRSVYLLMAATEEAETTSNRTVQGFSGWISCYPKAAFSGAVFAGGVRNPGDIEKHDALLKAYEMGKHV